MSDSVSQLSHYSNRRDDMQPSAPPPSSPVDTRVGDLILSYFRTTTCSHCQHELLLNMRTIAPDLISQREADLLKQKSSLETEAHIFETIPHREALGEYKWWKAAFACTLVALALFAIPVNPLVSWAIGGLLVMGALCGARALGAHERQVALYAHQAAQARRVIGQIAVERG